MIPNNHSRSDSPAISPCLFDKKVYDVYCLIPALTIITIFAFLNKRVRLKPKTCNGRPGLVLPCCFAHNSSRNRVSIAIAFGVVGQSCYKLFIDIIGYSFLSFSSESVIKLTHARWGKGLTFIVWVLLYGVINFPIFACLMTDHLLVGAVFGFLYTLMKLTAGLVLVFSCPNNYVRLAIPLSRFLEESLIYTRLPDLLCHFFLLLHFSLILCKLFHRKIRGFPAEDSTRVVAKNHDYIHVTLLLGNKLDENSTPCKWFIKLRDKIYKPKPDFKFSTGIFSALNVAIIFIYQMTVSWTILISLLSELVAVYRIVLVFTKDHSLKNLLLKIFVDVYDKIEVSLYVSVFSTCALSVLLMLHFLKCHRHDVLMSYKTQQNFGNSPSNLVMRSLSYPGYQIAYIGLGYNFILANLIAIILFVGLFFSIIKAILWELVQEILPFLVVSISIWISQYLMGKLVFRDRRIPDITININNHRLYCIMSFFFFFYNILVGYVSSMLRMAKTLFLECLFMSRIDRTVLMPGYQTFDQGYMSYIGFLNVLKSYSHPVMLVFCQLLLDQQRLRSSQSSANEEQADRESRRSSTTAFNRWLLAYTLIKNPELQRSRKRLLTVSFLTDLESIVGSTNTGYGVQTAIELEPTATARPRVSASALNKWFIAVTMIRNPMLIFNRKGYLKNIILALQNPNPIGDQKGPSRDNELENGHSQGNGKCDLSLTTQEV